MNPVAARPFATSEDHRLCRTLHRRHGTTYYFASRRLRPTLRRHVDALYAFVRVPDEWVDNPGQLSLDAQAGLLAGYRAELVRSMSSERPGHPALRAFSDAMHELKMPLEEPLVFLDAMEMDLHRTRYQTYADLEGYMRGSAAAVGRMMAWVLGAPRDEDTLNRAMKLGNAMQLTNFIRDVGEDLQRGRIYLPLDDLAEFGVTPDDVLNRRLTPEFRLALKKQIERARSLYSEADAGIDLIPAESRLAVRLARRLYAKILDKVEERDCDVFSGRARTTRMEKIAEAFNLLRGS